ncbi:MAG: hypothetical protein AAF756_20990 [Pseudomonadota bacterium]
MTSSRLLRPVLGIGLLLGLVTWIGLGLHPDSESPLSSEAGVPEPEARAAESSDDRIALSRDKISSLFVSTAPPASEPSPSPAGEALGIPEEKTISIGEYIDPDDPATWSESGTGEVISIGEYIDPDDPSTWPESGNGEVISIGEYIDPDDPGSWPVGEASEPVSIGTYLDPDRPETWNFVANDDPVSVGVYKDPNSDRQ